MPQVDFETRTVLVVSPGVGHLGEKFNLTEVIMSDSHLDLKGIIPVSPLGPGGTALCFYPALVVFPVLIIDIPKTEPPATLHTTLTQGTSC